MQITITLTCVLFVLWNPYKELRCRFGRVAGSDIWRSFAKVLVEHLAHAHNSTAHAPEPLLYAFAEVSAVSHGGAPVLGRPLPKRQLRPPHQRPSFSPRSSCLHIIIYSRFFFHYPYVQSWCFPIANRIEFSADTFSARPHYFLKIIFGWSSWLSYSVH